MTNKLLFILFFGFIFFNNVSLVKAQLEERWDTEEDSLAFLQEYTDEQGVFKTGASSSTSPKSFGNLTLTFCRNCHYASTDNDCPFKKKCRYCFH